MITFEQMIRANAKRRNQNYEEALEAFRYFINNRDKFSGGVK